MMNDTSSNPPTISRTKSIESSRNKIRSFEPKKEIVPTMNDHIDDTNIFDPTSSTSRNKQSQLIATSHSKPSISHSIPSQNTTNNNNNHSISSNIK